MDFNLDDKQFAELIEMKIGTHMSIEIPEDIVTSDPKESSEMFLEWLDDMNYQYSLEGATRGYNNNEFIFRKTAHMAGQMVYNENSG